MRAHEIVIHDDVAAGHESYGIAFHRKIRDLSREVGDRETLPEAIERCGRHSATRRGGFAMAPSLNVISRVHRLRAGPGSRV